VRFSPTWALAALLPAALAPRPAAAAAALPPSPTRWVTDSAGLLSAGERRSLDSRLEAYERQTGHQVLVWIGDKPPETPPEDFSVHAFEAWKVGRKGLDDGLVVFLFPSEQVIRIEVGYGLEPVVPDAIASRVIREVMAPRLAAGDADAAVEAGVAALVGAIGGGEEAGGGRAGAPASGTPGGPSGRVHRPPSVGQLIFYGLLAVGFLILLITHPSFALFLLFQLLSGGRGGGGGGGGGFSGGGGRSGGGGATGSW
jgi:uncharacterized protein